MIDLTPIDVRRKIHDLPRRMFGGVDPDRTGDFLVTVAEAMEELVEENRILADRVEHLEEVVDLHEGREEAIVQAMTMAEELREEALEQAKREASVIVKRAKAEAEDLRVQANDALAAAREQLRRLHARRGQLVFSFRSFLRHELNELDSMDRTLRERAEEAGFSDLLDDLDPTPADTGHRASEGDDEPGSHTAAE